MANNNNGVQSLDISKQSHNNSGIIDHTLGADESRIDDASRGDLH